MKKIKIASILLLLTGLGSLAAAEDLVYFKMNLNEALMVYNVKNQASDISFSNSIETNLGYKNIFDDSSAIFVLYGFNYSGPGVSSFSKQGFSSRSIDQLFVAKYSYPLNTDIKLTGKLDFFYEFYRLTKTEAWKEGLYNFGKTGGAVGAEYQLNPSNLLVANLELHYFWFPNYKDLNREALYLIGGDTLPSDSVNQNFMQYTVFLNDHWELSREFTLELGYALNVRQYLTMTVDDEDLVASNNKKQLDFINDFKLGAALLMGKNFMLELKYRLIFLKSNYSFLYFKGFTSGTMNPDNYFIREYSSHLQNSINLPLSYLYSSHSVFTLELGYENKTYTDRRPQDIDGNFVAGEKQNHDAFMAMLYWSYRMYDNFTVKPAYIFKASSSNNKELVAGYNYKIHWLGVDLTFEF